tara:strand:+ start:973 stop:1146 length:174 start_codon:yes stop_codon:yes gene_type:complete
MNPTKKQIREGERITPPPLFDPEEFSFLAREPYSENNRPEIDKDYANYMEHYYGQNR